MVPKVWAMSDIYCQLIPNDDPNNACYEVVPRIGSFEVSLNGVVSTIFLSFYLYQLLFSKCMSGNWPSYPMVGERCGVAAQSVDNGQDISNLQTAGYTSKATRRPKSGMNRTATNFPD